MNHYEITRSCYYWSVLIFALDQLFSSKAKFEKDWVHPNNGFNILQFIEIESENNSDVIKAALNCSRKKNLIDEEILSLSKCNTIIHPVGWLRHCIIGLSPINFKNGTAAVFNYCELNFEPITRSKTITIPFSAKIFSEKIILQLLTEHLPSSAIKSTRFINIFGEKGTFVLSNY